MATNFEDKRAFLQGMGYTDQQLDAMKKIVDSLQKSRQEQGTLVREGSETTPVAEPEKETPVEEITFDKEALFKELSEGLATVLKPLQDEIKALKADNDLLKQAIGAQLTKELQQTTPKLSFTQLLTKSLGGDTSVPSDGRTTLGKSQPAETPLPKNMGVTGSPFINGILERQGQAQ